MLETPTMPKKKSPVGRPKSTDAKVSLASLKGSAGYADWFVGLVAFSHLPASILIEAAVREYAERHGYTKPQPQR